MTGHLATGCATSAGPKGGAAAPACPRTSPEQGGGPQYRREGSLWTSSQRRAHSLHEVSYRACFKPQLPEHYIAELSMPGDIVLDPFLGRGTTAIQAALMGRIAYGSDANPLSVMLARPRLLPPPLAEVGKRLVAMPASADVPAEDRQLEVFFHPRTLGSLVAMKRWFAGRKRSGELDSVDEWVRMIVISRLTGHSPGFFSVRTMPPNQAVSLQAQQKLNSKHGLVPREKDTAKIIMSKSARLLRSGIPEQISGHRLECAQAGSLGYVPDSSVSLIVTSPPFLDTVNYRQDNWLRCWFADIKTSGIRMDYHRTIVAWERMVRASFTSFARVVKRGGHVAFEVGEVCKGRVQLEHAVIRAVKKLPFKLVGIDVNRQKFTKTSNCWGVTNNAKGTNTNRVALFQRS